MMVKNIVIVLMLAAFLEIVLPRSDMKRYVNLVIGLFVILAVLNPVLTLVRHGLDLDVFDEISPTALETESLIQRGKEIANNDKEKAAAQYRDKLSKQIMGLVGLYQGVSATAVKVEIVEEPEAKNFGQIKNIIIYTDNKPGAVSDSEKNPISGIEVNVNEITTETEKDDGEKAMKADNSGGLRKIVADFYGLDPEQIQFNK